MQIKRLYQQFMDLAPHLAKLLPVLERVVIGTSFTGLLAGEAAAAATVDLTAVHTHLDKVTKANTALVRQLQDQTIQIAGVEEEVRRLRMALEHSERRVERVELETRLGRPVGEAAGRCHRAAAGGHGRASGLLSALPLKP